MKNITMFDVQESTTTPKRARTTHTDERELINDILCIYNGGKRVDVDPCYSIGRFWRGLPQPVYKFDLSPQDGETISASCDSLPLSPLSVNSIMFDPPFLIGIGESTSGKMFSRFSGFKNINELKSLYKNSLKEFYRILKDEGILIFKCQDTVTSGKQFLTHVFVVNEAEKIGYYAQDLFIIVRDSAIIDPRWGKQNHARKTHSYFLVFRKK